MSTRSRVGYEIWKSITSRRKLVLSKHAKLRMKQRNITDDLCGGFFNSEGVVVFKQCRVSDDGTLFDAYLVSKVIRNYRVDAWFICKDTKGNPVLLCTTCTKCSIIGRGLLGQFLKRKL